MHHHHLELSDFRRLKLVDNSPPDGECTSCRTGGDGGGHVDWWHLPNPLQKLFRQCTDDFFKASPFCLVPSSGDGVKKAEEEVPVDQLLSQPSVVSLIDKFIDSHGKDINKDSVKKSVAVSTDYRTRGNKDFVRNRTTRAAYYYTMAIVYAPTVDPERPGDGPDALSLAYGNRSAAFYGLGKYEACLADIAHAFATGYPPVKHPKLYLRKVECLMALKRFADAKMVLSLMTSLTEGWMNNEPDSELMEIVARMGEILDRLHSTRDDRQSSDDDSFSSTSAIHPEQMLSVIKYLSDTGRYEPSPSLPPFSAKLEPTSTANGNHCLVAKRDIAPGDILMVESPFVSVLDRKYEFHFCHHCCRLLEARMGENDSELCIAGSSVPCTHCTRVLYCSAACRAASWDQYHQFECAILPVLYEMTNFGRLALRTLLATGLDVASRVATRNGANEEEELPMPDFNNPKEVEANYETVCRLALPKRDNPPPEFAQFQMAAALMVRALMKQSQFVRTIEEAKLAGTIVARHFAQAFVKSHKISCRISLHKDSPVNVQVGERPFTIGRGMYPYLASAWRHSCDPNTKHTYLNGNLVLYRASKCIPKGTEVTIGLGESFGVMEWPERQEALLRQYGFKCDCAKCVLEGRDGLNGRYFPIGCKNCGSTLTRASRTSTTFNCSSRSCSTVMSLSTVARLYVQAQSYLDLLNRLCEIGSGSINTSPIPLHRLNQGVKHLEQLSTMKGMANYCKLSLLYYVMTCLFVANQQVNMAMFRKYYERHVAIAMANSGTTDDVYMMVINLANMYRQDAALACADRRVAGGILVPPGYPRTVKRGLELARLFTLADAEHEHSAPDVLVDGSRYSWNEVVELSRVTRGFE